MKQNKKEKSKKKTHIVLAIINILAIGNFYFYYNSLILGLIGALLINLTILIIEYLKSKGIIKRREIFEFNFKDKSTEELRKDKYEKKEYLKQIEKELDKRPKKLSEKIQLQTSNIITSSMIITILGIFYLGALSTYFGVNNEFTNPLNESLGLNQTYNLVRDVGLNLTTNFMNVGERNPKLFFWLWWIFVFWLLVLPILKIIYYIIKELIKKNEPSNRTKEKN